MGGIGGNVQVCILKVYDSQNIPLMKVGHHQINGFHLKILYFHKAVQGLKVQYRMDSDGQNDQSFGLASASWVFTIALTSCLDNSLVQAESHSVLMDNMAITMHTLQEFRGLLNLKKFALTPSGHLKYLGLILKGA